MSSKIKPSMITSLLLTMLLVFSFNIRGVSAGIPLAPKTPTPTPTQTLTRTPMPTRTNTATSTPITHTVTASATPGPAMKLTTLTPHPDAGLHTSYVYDNSPAIGVSTNDIYISLQVTGTTTSTGAFSPATIYPSIKNNRSSTLIFYWSAHYTESGIPEMVESSFGTDFSGSWSESGSGTISANGTWTPDVGILQLVASSCHNCLYTLNTTIHFSTVSGGSPYTPTASPTVTPTFTPTITATATATVTPTNSYTYNRTAAVAYADQWAHEPRNTNYPNYGVDADGIDCNDCTNYLSQVLEAGGLPQIPGSNDQYHWYTYQDIWGTWFGSGTWAATNLFNIHASHFQGIRYEYFPNSPSGLSAGDFFLMDLPTNPFDGPDHARIIVGMGTVLEGDNIGEWMLLANQHCTDRYRVRWDYNIPEGTAVWAWHVVY